MKDLWNYLKEQNRPILLYGMGDGAEKVISALEKYSLKISDVFASDGFVRPKTFKGFTVTDYKTAKQKFPDMIALLCFGTPLPEVIDNIKRIAGETELYAPDVPVYGGPLFNYEYYLENKEKIEKVKSILADETSKKCFDTIIDYKLSGKIDYLFSCETSVDEPYESFLLLNQNETFFDLGAYRGDTVADFISRVGSYNSIIAVEPDKKTFQKLAKFTENLDKISLKNAAVGAFCGETEFVMNGSRGSTVGSGVKIPSVSVDFLSKEAAPTFIKFDIEGAELDGISGAKQTVREYKPKMQIAAYHKSEDIFEIPLKILEINPDYKVYLRHFPCLPAWDTYYYFL